MKYQSFNRNTFLMISLFLIFFEGCSPEKSLEELVIGRWEASWETVADEGMDDLDRENLSMQGVMNFLEDGNVEVVAYGYEGCIFADDTLRHTLGWKFQDTLLLFIDQRDDNGLPYTINEISRDQMTLTLLENIHLTLNRN